MRRSAPASILTLVHNRRIALINLLEGLSKSSILPKEIIVVYINEDPYVLPRKYPFDIHTVHYKSDDHLNLAVARNLAISHSGSEFNIFLDVDCIPSPTLIANYLSYSDHANILLSGRVRYLKKGFSDEPGWMDNLMENSTPDPIRAALEEYSYELFWSLNFACSKESFRTIGGFDPEYKGYGAEDTDFSFSARKKMVPLITTDALAYHQYHPSYSPPLNHMSSIIENATLFYKKWQVWPMSGWIEKFRELGYVRVELDSIIILREPSAQEIATYLIK